MADNRKDLPPVTSPNFLDKVREALSVYLGNRGDVLNRGVTLRDLVDGGMATLNGRWGANGSGSPLVPVLPPVDPATEPYAIDLTPPPMPSGFVATAGLTNIFIECDAQTYTQGHGHAKTQVFGSTLTLPTFSDAVLVTEFTGTRFAFPSNLATAWHLWIKWVSADGVASVVPAGGTNGVSATTGKIGNADLNPLIIEAGNLAAGAVDATKFVSTIEPVTLVLTGPLPTVKSTSTIYFVPDTKLYRWNGAAYVASIPAVDVTGQLTNSQLADIAAAKVTGTLSDAQLSAITAAKVTGQIVGTQITDGAISTAKLAAGAVTANEIAANTITASQIAAGAITSTTLASGAVTAGKIAAGTIVAGDIAAGAITTTKLAAGAVTANEIAANTITTAKIAANAITAGEIATGAITAGKIAANAIAVGSAAIQNGAIVNAMIGNLAVDDAKIASLSAAKLTAGAIAVGRTISSTGEYSVGVPNWSINGAGLATFNNAVVRGAVYASSGTFSGTLNAVTINSGSINLQGDGGTGDGYLRSLSKWWNDGADGWILLRNGLTGNTLFEVKAGTNKLWMSSAGGGGGNGLYFGASPYPSGTTMTGTGFYADGNSYVCFGNSTKNLSFNTTNGLTINGEVVVNGNITAKAATEFADVWVACTDSVWTSFPFTMTHDGEFMFVGGAGYNTSDVSQNSDAWMDINGTSTTLHWSGNYSTSICIAIGGTLVAGSHYLNFKLANPAYTSAHAVRGTLLRSYK